MMLEIEPQTIVYRDVRLNQAYTTSLCITNPLAIPVDFTLRPSSQRYQISPNRIHLNAGQSIVVSVRLYISHFPNYAKGVRGQTDTIQLSSSFFEQRVEVNFFLHPRDSKSSRSPSPTRSRQQSRSSRQVSMSQMQEMIESRDETIAKLQQTIESLEKEHPNFYDVIHNRISIERTQFEEKSQKALQLLREKDEAIESLQTRLNDFVKENRDLQRKALEFEDKFKKNASHVRELQARLDSETNENNILQKRLESMHDADRNRASLASDISEDNKKIEKHTLLPDQLQEMENLREKTIDQAEQIEVLISEISRLRDMNEDNTHRNEDPSERMQDDEDSSNKKYENDIKQLRDELERYKQRCEEAEARTASITSPNVICEQQQLESSHEEMPTSNSSTFPFTEKVFQSQLSLMKERAVSAEQEIDRLRSQLELAEERASHTEESIRRLDQDRASLEDMRISLEKKARGLDARDAELSEKEKTLQDVMRHGVETSTLASGKDSVPVSRSSEEDSPHAWWSYVWHEARKNGFHLANSGDIISSSINEPGAHRPSPVQCESHDEQDQLPESSQADRLRDIIRSQAMEITTLRQARIYNAMQARKSNEQQRDALELSKREIKRLQAYIQAHAADKDTKLAEMATTIKSLSARSDMHAEVAIARQAVESEQLVNHNLRNDIQTYRDMLVAEQDKTASLRKEVLDLRSSLDACDVAQSLINIPGLNAAELIELFSGRLMWLQKELKAAQRIASEVSLRQKHTNTARRSRSGSHVDTSTSCISENVDRFGEPDSSVMPPSGVADAIRGKEPAEWQKQLFKYGDDRDELLDGLDKVVLARRVSSQELVIHELQIKVAELEEALTNKSCGENLTGEFKHPGDERTTIEKEAIAKRLALCQESLEEARDECFRLRRRQESSENELIACRQELQRTLGNIHICASCARRFALNSAQPAADTYLTSDDPDNTDDSASSCDSVGSDCLADRRSNGRRDKVENSCGGCKELKYLVRERTSQLKILMETLETLQLGGSKDTATVKNLLDRESSVDRPAFENLSDLIAAPVPPITSAGSWEVQALVKRIVELSADSTAQLASTAMAERRTRQLETNCINYQKRINKLLLSVKRLESANNQLKVNYAISVDKASSGEKLLLDQRSTFESKIEDLKHALREKEYLCQQQRVKCEELTKQSELSDREAFQQWFSDTVLPSANEALQTVSDSEANGDNFATHPNNESEVESVRNLVVTMLVQWRDQVGFYPRAATGPISKAEQKFLQRITDLVVEAHERANNAELSVIKSQSSSRDLERRLRATSCRLESAVTQLYRYKNRAESSERVIALESAHQFELEGNLLTICRNTAADAIEKVRTTTSSLLAERSRVRELETKIELLEASNRKLKADIAYLESNGDSVTKGREDAFGYIDEKIKDSERSLHKWFQVELPRLISGLPYSEDDVGAYGAEDALYALGITGDDKYRDRGGEGLHRLGIEKTYALAQALCTANSSRKSMENQIHFLKEKNFTLRERITELSGVISRWNTDDSSGGNTCDDFNEKKKLSQSAGEHHENSCSEVADFREKCFKLEEQIAVLRSECDLAQSREANMKSLCRELRKHEEDLKNRATLQLNRMRNDIEDKHVQELRDLRETYEMEKKYLTDELSRIADTFKEAEQMALQEKEVPCSDSLSVSVQTDEWQTGREKCMTTAMIGKENMEVEWNAGIDSAGEGSMCNSIDGRSCSSSSHQSHGTNDEHVNGEPLDVGYDNKGSNADHLDCDVDTKTSDRDQVSNVKVDDNDKHFGHDDEGTSDSQPGRNGDAGTSSNHVASDSLCDMEGVMSSSNEAALRRELNIERTRYNYALNQIRELEQLLETQRSAFRRHLDTEKEVIVASAGLMGNSSGSSLALSSENQAFDVSRTFNSICSDTVNRTTDYTQLATDDSTVSSSSSSADDVKGSKRIRKDTASPLEQVKHEDPVFWPSISVMLDELNDILPSAVHHMRKLPSTNCTVESLMLIRKAAVIATRLSMAYKNHLEKPPTSDVNDAFHSSVSSDRDVTGKLKEVLTRVENLEHTLSADDSIPPFYIEILQDLRDRVCILDEETAKQRQVWGDEQYKLQRSLDECRTELQKLAMSGTDERLAIIKSRYEEALKNAQDALDEQTQAARDQIIRLEEIIQSESPASRATASEGPRPYNSENVQDGILRLQELLDHSGDEIDKYRTELARKEKLHAEELQRVWGDFEKYRNAQQVIVAALENEMRAMEEEKNASNLHPLGENVTLDEAQTLVYKLSQEYRIKKAQLQAINDAFRGVGAAVSSEALTPNILTRNTQKALPLREELLEARLQATEKEVFELQRLLDKHDGAHKMTMTTPTVVLDGKNVDSSKRDQSVRKLYTQELDGLRAKNASLIESEKSVKAESEELKSTASGLKEQVSSLRDENSRKSKLIASLRSSRAADAEALERWKNEFLECEDKLKRATRALGSKEAIIKDLKNKNSELEATLRNSLASQHVREDDGGDITSLTAPELRKRLKASELERGRARARLNAFRDKVCEMEREIRKLSDENDKLKQVVDKSDVLRLTISRKDAMIKSQKESLEKLRVELLAFKEISASKRNDLEKHIRLLHKQLEQSEEKFKELRKHFAKQEADYQSEIKRVIDESTRLKALLRQSADPEHDVSFSGAKSGADVDDDSSQRISFNELQSIMTELSGDGASSSDSVQGASSREAFASDSRTTKLSRASSVAPVQEAQNTSVYKSFEASDEDTQSIERRLKLLVKDAMND